MQAVIVDVAPVPEQQLLNVRRDAIAASISVCYRSLFIPCTNIKWAKKVILSCFKQLRGTRKLTWLTELKKTLILFYLLRSCEWLIAVSSETQGIPDLGTLNHFLIYNYVAFLYIFDVFFLVYFTCCHRILCICSDRTRF